MINSETIRTALAARHRLPVEQCQVTTLGGGVTGATFQVHLQERLGFLKWLPEGDALEAEADGLAALAPAIRVPEVIDHGPLAGGTGLLIEWLTLAPMKESHWSVLGQQLHALHQVQGEQYGYPRDNWIGASPQINTADSDWARFFVERRLAPQLRWARDQRLSADRVAAVETVMAKVPEWLKGVSVTPSLVHGDLWQGNVAALNSSDKNAVAIFDPAVYYGHDEVDLAMLSLFGQVPNAFYNAYGKNSADPAFQHRKQLYNLYHLLNHFNLFGGGYAAAVADTVTALLRH